MHNNYHLLRQLSSFLETTLKDSVVSECFSQSKEELILRFETNQTPFFIKASLLSNFTCLSFPENFQRARKNSVDLFESLIGRRVKSLQQFENERSFAIHFSDAYAILFKMHGNRSNLILFEKNKILAVFKNSIQGDVNLDLHSLDRSIDWRYETFVHHIDNLPKLYFTFGKPVWSYLHENGFNTVNIATKWEQLQAVRATLENPKGYFIIENDNTISLSLLPFGKIIKEHTHPTKALTDFYHTYTQGFALSKEKLSALTALRTQLQQTDHYLTKTKLKLVEVQHDSNYKIWADLIMANLHNIPSRAENISLENFYNHNIPIDIKIKKEYSPQKNAELFYRKSKNQQIEIDRLQQALNGKEYELQEIQKKIEALESANDLKSIRTLSTNFDLKDSKEKQVPPLPYHIIEYKDFKIYIGKNAQSNDVLTLKHSFKDDLWLHAKDVAGSHVVLKYQSGKKFPKDVIERAAQLAAYHSKRKNESLCPVIVTPKKFVRKRKGDPAGMVVVEREEVILVEPRK